MSAHPHAELMKLYAEDAAETECPWERWQTASLEGNVWCNLGDHPRWEPSYQYRRKPRTININGFDVPEPVREVQGNRHRVWVVDFANMKGARPADACEVIRQITDGICHATREAAELHAKALMSFTRKEGA